MSELNINMNDRSKVKNLCDWSISWVRSNGTDEQIKANQVILIQNSEIEVQVQNGNLFFNGTDGRGSHAKVFIENPELRSYLGFDNNDENDKRTQLIVDDSICGNILSAKSIKAFKKALEDYIVTNQEKIKIINYVRKNKFNEYDKIQILENHCDMSLKN